MRVWSTVLNWNENLKKGLKCFLAREYAALFKESWDPQVGSRCVGVFCKGVLLFYTYVYIIIYSFTLIMTSFASPPLWPVLTLLLFLTGFCLLRSQSWMENQSFGTHCMCNHIPGILSFPLTCAFLLSLNVTHSHYISVYGFHLATETGFCAAFMPLLIGGVLWINCLLTHIPL